MESEKQLECMKKAYSAVAAINISLMILIGVAIWITGSIIPLWALLFMASASCDECKNSKQTAQRNAGGD